MHKSFLSAGALLGGLAVALGAFGAHKLKELVPAESVSSFQTGVQYQMYHALALLLAGMLWSQYRSASLKWAGNCFIAGIVLFSGSLYLLTALKATGQVGLKGIGIITPFGGLFFIAGWLLLLLAIVRKSKAA
ncbi:MAG TPA: DUF423 domain-containing protein [Chitinophagaceae bacterium]|nr:DUF423 domain-containing protein [Chitinophagaceae bacterium]